MIFADNTVIEIQIITVSGIGISKKIYFRRN